MGLLNKSHLVEAVIWLLIVAIFFGYSFEFNQAIEIYEFGATGWPRVVLVLLLLAAIGNVYYQYHHGSAAQKGRVGVAETDDGEMDYSDRSALIKIILILLTPFIFALLLKPVGIYFGAPFFIALVIWLFGERRWKPIFLTTLVIYFIFLALFVVILNAPLPQGNTSPFYDFSALILKLNTDLQSLW